MQESFAPLPFRQHTFFEYDRIVPSQRKGSGLQMLATVEGYLLRGQRQLRRWALDSRIQWTARVTAYAGSGFFLSAAGLRGGCQPLAMGLILSMTGWRALVTALGAAAGYHLFWGSQGLQGMVWAGLGYLLALMLGKMRISRQMPLLLPGAAGVVTAVTGLVFLFFRQEAAFLLFLLRVLLAPVSALLFRRSVLRRDALTDWICGGIGVLALARVTPVPWLGLGYVASGIFCVWLSFPAAALAGLGLDLARMTPVPMTAVVCCAWFARMLPFPYRWMRYAVPGAACLGIMGLCGIWDVHPLPGLILGGILGYCLPPRPDTIQRRGETGIAQVRLEMTAGVLAYTQRLLLEVQEPEIDEEALLQRAVSQACGTCVNRESCRERQRLGMEYLHSPEAFVCRRPAEIQGELLRSRERLQFLKADRQRRQEYRGALVQQYQFLAAFLRQLSDQLPRRGERPRAVYRVEVSARSHGRGQTNGDRCLAFPGTDLRYYVLLCDGMGTGLGAAQEGQSTGQLLRQMLTAGFPAEHAFRSINSILALRGQAGAVTLDLAEIRLDSGRVTLYKWGAAPSWIVKPAGAEKIGTATPPPGICATDARELVIRLSLRRGEMLILLSDGVEAGERLRRGSSGPVPPGELAEWLLEECGLQEDDATVVVLRLHPRCPSA